jgi:hypothetical protein
VDYNLRPLAFHIIICFIDPLLLILTFILSRCPVKCIYPCSRLTPYLVVKPINWLYYLSHLHVVLCSLNWLGFIWRLLEKLIWGVLSFDINWWLSKSWSILKIWWSLRAVLVLISQVRSVILSKILHTRWYWSLFARFSIRFIRLLPFVWLLVWNWWWQNLRWVFWGLGWQPWLALSQTILRVSFRIWFWGYGWIIRCFHTMFWLIWWLIWDFDTLLIRPLVQDILLALIWMENCC